MPSIDTPNGDRLRPPVSADFRKRIYGAFAKKANGARVRWVVLHGIEGYPAKIGRDLDVTCKSSSETERLLEIFAACLRREGVRWIVYSPTWGRRIVGITDDYHVVELHTVERVRVANVDFKPDWGAVEYVEELFPIERSMTFFKACLMPALVGGDSWHRKSDDAPMPARLPWWMEPAAKKAQAREAVTIAAKVILCGGFSLVHPLASVENSLRWLRTKLQAPFRPISPVYALPGWLQPGEFENLVKKRLSELFLDVVCGDTLTLLRVKTHQSRQRLVYMTRASAKGIATVEIGPGRLSEDNLLEFMVAEFCKFNERW